MGAGLLVGGIGKGIDNAAQTIGKALEQKNKEKKDWENFVQRENYLHDLQMQDWQTKQDAERAQKVNELRQKAEALSSYLKGGVQTTQLENTYNPNDLFDPNKSAMPQLQQSTQFTPFTPEQKAELLTKMGLTSSQVLDELAPAKYTNLNFQNPDAVYGINSKTGKFEQVPYIKGNPSYKKPKPADIYLGTGNEGKKKFDFYGHRLQPGEEVPSTNIKKIDGKSYVITSNKNYRNSTENDGNGNPRISKEYQKDILGLQKNKAEVYRLFNLLSNFDGIPPTIGQYRKVQGSAPDGSGDGLLDTKTGMFYSIGDVKSQAQKLANINNEGANYIKRHAPKSAMNWYAKVYNAAKGTPSASDYLNNLDSAYSKGVINEGDYDWLRELATFLYNKNLYDIQQPQDNEEQ